LDVGAGIGEFVGKASPYFDATGTEVSQEAIRLARERLGLRLLHGAIEGASELKEGASELKAGSFDVISLIHVLEHVPDPAHTIRRCRELLRPGGWLFVAVPNDSPAAWYKCYWGTGRALWRHIRRSGTPISYEETPALGSVDLHLADASAEIHLSHFSPECLRRFLSREGFDAVFMGPDPCHTTTGLQRLKDDMDFHIWRMLALFGWHGYQTISVIARRAELR
jgi:SAM-dependent methyltransferase